jgi:hypothetical protein
LKYLISSLPKHCQLTAPKTIFSVDIYLISGLGADSTVFKNLKVLPIGNEKVDYIIKEGGDFMYFNRADEIHGFCLKWVSAKIEKFLTANRQLLNEFCQ